MSLRGALVEAPVIPNPGDPVVLKRGALQISGRIAWKADRKAGIAFEATARPGDWMARQANAHQDQIDQIVTALRSPTGISAISAADEGTVANHAEMESELALLHAELTQLGNALAADVILVATHPEIQCFDIALKRIERIMNALKAQH
jgi:hypothetical protein